MPNRILRIGFRPKNFRNNPKARKTIRFTNRACNDMSMRLIFAIIGHSSLRVPYGVCATCALTAAPASLLVAATPVSAPGRAAFVKILISRAAPSGHVYVKIMTVLSAFITPLKFSTNENTGNRQITQMKMNSPYGCFERFALTGC